MVYITSEKVFRSLFILRTSVMIFRISLFDGISFIASSFRYLVIILLSSRLRLFTELLMSLLNFEYFASNRLITSLPLYRKTDSASSITLSIVGD
jgi:hypothetical protein